MASILKYPSQASQKTLVPRSKESWFRPEDINLLLGEAIDGTLLAQQMVYKENKESLVIDELEIVFSNLKLLEEAIGDL